MTFKTCLREQRSEFYSIVTVKLSCFTGKTNLNILYRLENALRSFACLTTGDVIAINYNEKVQYTAPSNVGFISIPSIW